MRQIKLPPRVSLLGSVKSKRAIRLNTSKPKYPPSYSKWLGLKERQQTQDTKLAKFKRRKVDLDRELDAELRLIEVQLLYELARDEVYKVPRDALRAIASCLWEYHRGSKFTHWSSRLPRSNERDSDPQLEHLKGLAVAFIYQADSKVEQKRRRTFVAQHFGKDDNRKRDWELLAEKGKLFVPDYSELPVQIDDSLVEWAGQKFQVLKARQRLQKK